MSLRTVRLQNRDKLFPRAQPLKAAFLKRCLYSLTGDPSVTWVRIWEDELASELLASKYWVSTCF